MNDGQKKALQAPIPTAAVTQREQAGQTLDYVEGWWVINRMNEIFGNGEWGSELVTLEHVTTIEAQAGKFDVTYRAIVRLTGPFQTQTGVGFASNRSSKVGDAHEGAGKSAETDALKRAAVKLGLQLGLALYEKPNKQTGERTHVKDSLPTWTCTETGEVVEIKPKLDEVKSPLELRAYVVTKKASIVTAKAAGKDPTPKIAATAARVGTTLEAVEGWLAAA
jgi:hypothetical protein